MKKSWSDCKKILCIRADNMGDLLMSSPAIRALKKSFPCTITALTSSMAAPIAGYIPGIDEVITCDFPWVKINHSMGGDNFLQVVEKIKQVQFDAAVIFTVYSQNPLPAVMLAYLAGIPLRLAYCRENPYDLLTDWVSDKEPYTFIRHQVQRDLDLVAAVGAYTDDNKLALQVLPDAWDRAEQKLAALGHNLQSPWLIMHSGVSEKKREYSAAGWVAAGKRIVHELGYQVLLTGVEKEKELTDQLQKEIGPGAVSLAGSLSLEEYIALVYRAPLVISVNTGTIHIAAALSVPVLVLYALTNPQHLPWKGKGKALLFSIPETERSRNEVISHVHNRLFPSGVYTVTPDEIVQAADELLKGEMPPMPELVPLRPVPPE